MPNAENILLEDQQKPQTLLEYLRLNPVNEMIEDGVFVSTRFKDMNFPFTIKAISGDEFSSYRTLCNSVKRHGKVDFDQKRFAELVVLNHTVTPNFKSREEIEAVGCRTPEEYLYRCLKSGEIEELQNRITTLSGFDEDVETLRGQAKN